MTANDATCRIHRGPANVRSRRIFLVATPSSEGLLTEPAASTTAILANSTVSANSTDLITTASAVDLLSVPAFGAWWGGGWGWPDYKIPNGGYYGSGPYAGYWYERRPFDRDDGGVTDAAPSATDAVLRVENLVRPVEAKLRRQLDLPVG